MDTKGVNVILDFCIPSHCWSLLYYDITAFRQSYLEWEEPIKCWYPRNPSGWDTGSAVNVIVGEHRNTGLQVICCYFLFQSFIIYSVPYGKVESIQYFLWLFSVFPSHNFPPHCLIIWTTLTSLVWLLWLLGSNLLLSSAMDRWWMQPRGKPTTGASLQWILSVQGEVILSII